MYRRFGTPFILLFSAEYFLFLFYDLNFVFFVSYQNVTPVFEGFFYHLYIFIGKQINLSFLYAAYTPVISENISRISCVISDIRSAADFIISLSLVTYPISIVLSGSIVPLS